MAQLSQLRQEIPLYDVELHHDALETSIEKLLGFIRPNWKREDVQIKVPKNGFINTVVICSNKALQEEDQLVVKINSSKMGALDFTPKIEDHFQAEVALNKLGISPALVCHFQNGSVHLLQKGKSYTWAEHREFVTNQNLGRLVMRELAKYHNPSLVQLGKSLGMSFTHSFRLQQAKTILSRWPKTLDNDKFKSILPKEQLQHDFIRIENMIDQMDLELTLVHGDANPSNVIFTEGNEAVKLIDYDFCGSDYGEMDLAWFFLSSWIGTSNRKDFPDQEWLTRLLKEYLTMKKELNNISSEPTEEEIKKLRIIVERLSLVLYFMGILHHVFYEANPPETEIPIEGDYLDLALSSQEKYLMVRDKILENTEKR